jgi:hypothetical protein
MKKLILVALVGLISLSAKSQQKADMHVDTIPMIDGINQYQEVVMVDSSLTKDQLYKNAKNYFLNVFIGAKDAFQYDDKEEGRLIGKGFFSVSDYKSVFPGVASLKWDINYNVEIVCKDGRYRYRFYDMYVTKESHVAENNYRNVHFTINEAYNAIAKQRGPYKKLYPRVINKAIGEFKADIARLKDNMLKKQQDYSANF